MKARLISVCIFAGFYFNGNLAAVWGADPPTTRPSSPSAAVAADSDPLGDEALKLTEPIGRQGGGVRSSRCVADPAFWISVLAPAAVYHTEKESPDLVFYLSKPTDKRVMVTITELIDLQAPTLHIWSSDGMVAAGLHKIALSTMGVTLKPDTVYRWVAAVRWDETNPATQFFDQGLLLRESPSEVAANQEKLAKLDPAARASAYQGHYFYDAVALDYDSLLQPGDNAAARRSLEQLLKDAGLKDVNLDVINKPETQPAS